MKKFMMIYAGAQPSSDLSEEEMMKIMGKWKVWMDNVGDTMVDMGSPLGPSVSIVDDGSSGTPLEVTGYTILEAEDMDAAKALADGHPFLSEGKGDYSISLHELMPIPGM